MMGPGWYWAVLAVRVAATMAVEEIGLRVLRFAQRRREPAAPGARKAKAGS